MKQTYRNKSRSTNAGYCRRMFLLAVLSGCIIFIQAAVPAMAVTDFAPFYRLGIGARSLGMGGSFVSVADDPTTIYWNPSGLASINTMAITGMHLNTYQIDSYHDFVAGVFPLSDYSTWGLYYLRASTPNIPITTLGTDGLPKVADYTKNDRNLVAFSYGRKFGKTFSAGCTLKYISERLSNATATGWAADLGCLYQASPTLSLGMAVQDVTETLISWNTGHADTVPPLFKFGLNGKLFDDNLTLSLDLDLIRDRPSVWHLGTEYRFGSFLAVRAGLNDSQLTAGLGFKFGRWEMNYAFENHDLGDHHRLAFTVWWLPDKIDRSATADVESILGRYQDSLDQILGIDPQQEEAIWETRQEWVPEQSTETPLVPLAPVIGEEAKQKPRMHEKPALPVARQESEEDDFLSLLESIQEADVEHTRAAEEPESEFVRLFDEPQPPAPAPVEQKSQPEQPVQLQPVVPLKEGAVISPIPAAEDETDVPGTAVIKPIPSPADRKEQEILEAVPELPPQPFKHSEHRIYSPSPSKEEEAFIKDARESMNKLADQVKSYNFLSEHPAMSLEELVGKILKEIPRDPWGTQYKLNTVKGTIVSAGRDREFETLDDLHQSLF